MPTGYDLGDLNIEVNSGGKIAIESGAAIDIESGGELRIGGTAVTSNATELNLLDGVTTLITDMVGSMTFTVNAEAGNVINVDVQLKDYAGTNMAKACDVEWFLSDASTGFGIAGTAPDGGTAIGTNGTAVEEYTAEKSGKATTAADGTLDVDITESGVDTWYLVITPLCGGARGVSTAITFA